MKDCLRFKNCPKNLLLIFIFLLGFFFRIYGLNWDQNHHLHPDERFLTMVTGAFKWPSSFLQYLNPQTSPLNPYNVGYGFFVYGTLPLIIVKAAAEVIRFDLFDYHNITLVGRLISAFFDFGTLFLVYQLAQKLFNQKTALLAAFFYAIAVLPIQLAHFFAVDTFLVFFITLSFYFLILIISGVGKLELMFCFLGVSCALALASKISALYFLPVIGLGLAFFLLRQKNLLRVSLSCFFFILFAYVIFRIADPRVFSDSNFLNLQINPQFISNLRQLKSFSDPKSLFPPSIQWIKTKPIIFPLKNMILWGLGLPLGVFALISVFAPLLKIGLLGKTSRLDYKDFSYFLIWFWVVAFFLYQGVQFAKPMRYFFPFYPFLLILTAKFLVQIEDFLRRKAKFFPKSVLFLIMTSFIVWPLSFLAIYSRPHSRVLASKWIYQNIPAGSVISCEYWDDCLPLPLNGLTSSLYQTEILTLYDPDTPEKWQKINQQLARIDYLIMSSNRLWGSISKVPEIYPQTAKFYQDLFAEKLNFKKVAEITSRPTIPFLNIFIPDDNADESFTVYDHPKVIIFKKRQNKD